MGPRKSASEWSTDSGYPGVLHKLCKEGDVLVIPNFVPHYVGRQSEQTSPRRSKDSRVTGNSFVGRDSTREDFQPCDALNHPQIGIMYNHPEDRDAPVGVICRGIYLEYSLIHAIGKSLRPYPTISTLRIENCCLSKDIAEVLAQVLGEEPGRRISDLSLDGNEDISAVLPLFVTYPTGVRYLSLRRCSLDDDDVKIFAKALEHSDDRDHKLQVLNLGMNKIGDAGISHLANALRTNRSLLSISLAGNQIGDEGVMHLTEVLQKFPLTHEEIMLRRRRVFDEILKKKNALGKYLEELKMKGDAETTPSTKSVERFTTGRKVRGPDGKIRCLSSRDKRGKLSQGKVNSGEKFRGKIRTGSEEVQNGVDSTPSEMLAIAQQVESEFPPDKHPFVNEGFFSDDWIWCLGCWSLSSINLAYNSLTEASVEYFTAVFNFQAENLSSPKTGLLRLVLLPGNSINENSIEFQKLQSAIITCSTKKDVPELGDPLSVGSLSSARRINSSTRRMKNR